MADKKEVEKKDLKQDVAAKYNIEEGFLYGGKLVFPKFDKHGVKNKPAHELTLAEVDKLYAAGAVKGVFTLKENETPVAPAAETGAADGTGKPDKKKNQASAENT